MSGQTMPDVGAMILFTTRPTDRALDGWMPHEVPLMEYAGRPCWADDEEMF